MKLFLDTANLEEIKKARDFIDGITTNPTLFSKEAEDFKKLIKEICKTVNGPISVEVISKDYNEMLKEAKLLTRLGKNIVIKVPMTPEGIKATEYLTKKGIKVNVTLIFSTNQALLAAKAGATYASPFIGRIDDIGMNGLGLLEDIKILYETHGFKTKIIAASIRSPEQVKESALIGIDIVTLPPKILWELFNHPLTDNGLETFLKDWGNEKKEVGTELKLEPTLQSRIEKTPQTEIQNARLTELTPIPLTQQVQEQKVKKGLLEWLFGKKTEKTQEEYLR